ncbi:heparan-alpha-glucosaminide N-acetyltransferase-like [Achlya hypogyna]|uniref:Heparan-alpha-glucosaminide N-acetyltransferase-like n=1 Tax=Achlya hypogyna TaxID=1202772 RepID=A0A1V9YJI0_ACHHY|nr:heparan-alpha-glucosaminide N-acetyltransferase-like [Achlya hypogyna]
MDLAFVATTYAGEASVALFGQNDNCHKCALVRLLPVGCSDANCSTLSADPALFSFYTVYPWSLELREEGNDSSIWASRSSFDDTANYSMTIEARSDTVDVAFATTVAPEPSRLLLIVGILLLVWLGACVGTYFYKKSRNTDSQSAEDDASECHENAFHVHDEEAPADAPLLPVPAPRRVASLDVFRGLTITCMIFTNLGGGGYWFWSHATWNGLTPADCVFPWFVWIMGVTMTLGVKSHVKRGAPHWRLLWTSFLRAIKLFCLGLLVNNIRDLESCRIPGVLQTFAFAYFAVTVAVVSGLYGSSPTRRFQRVAIEAAVVTTLLLCYLGFVFFLPVPGCPTGYFGLSEVAEWCDTRVGPGGDSDDGAYRDCLGGAHRVVDRYIFGDAHLLPGGTPSGVYNTPGPWDPEGFLNWLAASVLTYLGYVVGGAFLDAKDWTRKVTFLSGSSVASGLLGLLLCGFRVNDGFIPINKNLWSPSFVLVTSALACGALGVIYLLVDKWPVWSGAPFSYAGMNAIVLYVGHEVLIGYFPFTYDRADTHTAWTISNLIGCACWLAIAYAMHRRNLFITV